MKGGEMSDTRNALTDALPSRLVRVQSISLILLIVLVSLAASPSFARAAKITASSSNIGPLNTSGPMLTPGFHLTFSCVHSGIELNLTKYCKDQSSVSYGICDSPTCQFSLRAFGDYPWYEFVSWTAGSVIVNCDTCAETTLTVHVPNPSQYYSGSVIENAQADWVNVTLNTFVNWTCDGWTPGYVQTCMYLVGCTNGSNGQVLEILPGYQYSLAAHLNKGYTVEEWQTDAGTILNSLEPTAQYTASSGGNLSLIVLDSKTSGGWAGYVYSPPGSAGRVTGVTGEFLLPKNYSMSLGVWVGIGGLSCGGISCLTRLWQAGVEINATPTGALITPWYLATWGLDGSLVWGHGFTINPGDLLKMTVNSTAGDCTSAIQHLSISGSPTWSGRYSGDFDPYNQSGEWIMEPKGLSPGNLIPINVSSMNVNGAFNIAAGFIDEEYNWLHYTFVASPLTSGVTSFSISS